MDEPGKYYLYLNFITKERMNKWDTLRGLVPFVQFKKREKHPWRSGTFSKVAAATLLKVALFRECFPRFLNCANGTKSRNAPHIFYP